MVETIARIQLLIDTTAHWQASNPILLSGEIGLEIKPNHEIAFKVGNGTTSWNLLDYAVFTPSEVVAMRDELQDQIDNIVIAASESGDSSIEVSQARVNASGVTYATLKARLDAMDVTAETNKAEFNAEITDLKSDLKKANGANVIDINSPSQVEKFIKPDGTTGSGSHFKISNKIYVKSGDNYKISNPVKAQTSAGICFFNTTDNVVSGGVSYTPIQDDYIVEAPENASYMLVTYAIENQDVVKVTSYNAVDKGARDIIENVKVESSLGYADNMIDTNNPTYPYKFIKPDGTIGSGGQFNISNKVKVISGCYYSLANPNPTATSAGTCFFDASDNVVSGGFIYTPYKDEYIFKVPDNASYIKATYNRDNLDVVKLRRLTSADIKSRIDIENCFDKISEIEKSRTFTVSKYLAEERRVATINFQFDDNMNDSKIVDIFNNNNVKCGFAFIANDENITLYKNAYLEYQANGFEIMSHSIDGTGMTNLTDESVRTRMRTSKRKLIEAGFNVRGWVTPSSVLKEDQRYIAKDYYDFAYTIYYGAYDAENPAIFGKTTELNQLSRVSLQLSTLEQCKLAVDQAIERKGFLTFYGHASALDSGNYMTTANLNMLLSYINDKASEEKCYVLKPSDAVDYYFHVRHSDYLDLLNL